MEMEHLVSKELAAFKDVVRRVTRPVPSVEQLRHEAREIILDKTFRDLQRDERPDAAIQAGGIAGVAGGRRVDVEGDFQGL